MKTKYNLRFFSIQKLFANTSTECTKTNKLSANSLPRRMGYADPKISWSLRETKYFLSFHLISVSSCFPWFSYCVQFNFSKLFLSIEFFVFFSHTHFLQSTLFFSFNQYIILYHLCIT